MKKVSGNIHSEVPRSTPRSVVARLVSSAAASLLVAAALAGGCGRGGNRAPVIDDNGPDAGTNGGGGGGTNGGGTGGTLAEAGTQECPPVDEGDGGSRIVDSGLATLIDGGRRDGGPDGSTGPCIPFTSGQVCPGRCGNVSDGCGGRIACGTSICAANELCDETTNTCGPPGNACSDPDACGTIRDGCGNLVDCGSCTDLPGSPPTKRTCNGGNNRCEVCIGGFATGTATANEKASLCARFGVQCGSFDYCGETIACATCPADKVCNPIARACEAPTTVSCNPPGQPARCGVIHNGSGGQLDCGGCPAGQQCGVGGIPNLCVPSRPPECAQAGRECGQLTSVCTAVDGGSIVVDCGTCPSGKVCRTNGTCGDPCTPLSPGVACAGSPPKCGAVSDGCGGTINCGGCGGGQTCNPSNNTCCSPVACGNFCGVRDNGCGATVRCNGTCTGGTVCQGNGTCCTRKTCSDFPGRCGVEADGCGGTVFCGCGAGQVCEGGSCRACVPRTCAANYPGRCGSFSNGCGGTLNCSCTGSNTCGGGGQPGFCGCNPATTCPPGFVGPLVTCTGTLICGA